MVIYCCVPGCNNNYKSRIGFHSFPKDVLTRKKWVAKTKCFRAGYKSSFEKVCKDHFQSDDFTSSEKRFLKKTAVPSVNLPKTINIVTEHSYCFEDSMVNTYIGRLGQIQ